MLRACRRVLRPGGRTAFHTIQPTPGLTPYRRSKAHAAGPVAVAVPTSYESLLRTAGFVDVTATDLTAEYRATQQRWIDATHRREGDLRRAMGDELFDERATNRSQTLAAIDDGLLSRFLYTATRP